MKPYYRIPQRVMTKVTGRMYQEPTLIYGAGSLFKVKGLLVDSGVQSVLVVTTPGFIRRETLQPFFDSLEEGELNVTIFSDVVPDPTVECVEALAQAYRDGECEAIVAIGGGSVIDCAKVAGALIARPGKTVPELRGVLKVRKELPDFYAVPTTAEPAPRLPWQQSSQTPLTANTTSMPSAISAWCRSMRSLIQS